MICSSCGESKNNKTIYHKEEHIFMGRHGKEEKLKSNTDV